MAKTINRTYNFQKAAGEPDHNRCPRITIGWDGYDAAGAEPDESQRITSEVTVTIDEVDGESFSMTKKVHLIDVGNETQVNTFANFCNAILERVLIDDGHTIP